MTKEKYGDSYGEKFRQYEDRIAELEKENAELQQKIQILNLNGNIVFRELTKAKELLNMFLRLHYLPIVDEATLYHKVEQFLNSEVEK